MTASPTADAVDAARLRSVHVALCEAMVTADIAGLDEILASGYTLQHMTGYVQNRAEWLEEISTGGMQYSSIRNQRMTVDVDQAFLEAETVTVARIWGSHGSWRLRLQSWFAFEDERLVIARTIASTW